ncbi:hypothetical protein [Paraflavitalea speifideaquila]|uniref:hypothetical protein n=1 Tax=Paraflavitalea speifideaquila TaxID=3076558 RepID=UPI0028E6D037|nr:hypothetical protein [Paraflavitalea speifideiaquila]
MKLILGYLREYVRGLSIKLWLLVTLLMAVLIYFNYTAGIERSIIGKETLPRLAGFFVFTSLFLAVPGYCNFYYISIQLPHPSISTCYYWPPR